MWHVIANDKLRIMEYDNEQDWQVQTGIRFMRRVVHTHHTNIVSAWKAASVLNKRLPYLNDNTTYTIERAG